MRYRRKPKQFPIVLTLDRALSLSMKRPEFVDDMAPHTQMVYETLAKQSFMAQDELIEETGLPFRVVREATTELVETGLLEEIIYSYGKLRLYRTKPSHRNAENRDHVSA